MKWKCIMSVLVLTAATAGPLYAAPSLGTILNDSTYNGITDTGQSYVNLNPGENSSMATIIIESAGFAPTNKFGIYDPTSGNMLELFAGSDTPGSSVQVNFNLLAGTASVGAGPSVAMGTTFGFYLDSSARGRGGLFYSDSSWNTGQDAGKQKALLFNTTGSGLTGNPDLVVAFEDLRYRYSDKDYNDMVVGVTNVTPVPAPGAIALGGIGTILVGWLKRRRSL